MTKLVFVSAQGQCSSYFNAVLHKVTFLFLWQSLTSSTSTDTEFSSFSEFCNCFSDPVNNKITINAWTGLLCLCTQKPNILAHQFYGKIQWKWVASLKPHCTAKRLQLKLLYALRISCVEKVSKQNKSEPKTTYLWDSGSTFDFSTLNSRSFKLKHFLKQQTPANIWLFCSLICNYLTATEEHQSAAEHLSTCKLSHLSGLHKEMEDVAFGKQRD